MTNCYDCNHCEVCKWIDEFKDKDVCSFYEDGTPLNEVLDKIRAEIKQNSYPIVHGVNNHEFGMTLYGILQVLDKYKYETESEDK